mgnify:CR=1 FL=1
MIQVKTSNGVLLILEERPLGKGGEATVHRIINAPPQYKNCCIKIYNNPKPEIKEKIEFIVKNPITVQHNLVGFLRICTPKEFILDSQNRAFKGYIMPLAFDGSYTLQKLLTRPKTISWHKEYDLNTANGFRRNLGLCLNIALITYLVHTAGLMLNKNSGGYVLVDMKPENIMVTKDAQVSLIDFDSIQVNVTGKKVFPASVRSPEYASPEVLKHNNQQPLHYTSDNFTLALILYKVMCGLNPYAGSLKGAGGTETAQAILGGFYPHGKRRSSFISIPKQHERVNLLSEKIRKAFEQTLSESIEFPLKRASAQDWGIMLAEELKSNDYANKRKVMPNVGIASTINKASVNPSRLLW